MPRGEFRERVPHGQRRVRQPQGRPLRRRRARSRATTFARKAVHRGAAFGDIDNDGRIDVVVTALDGALELWRNVSPAPNHWLLVKTVGTKSNRDGMGAKLKIVTAPAPSTAT